MWMSGVCWASLLAVDERPVITASVGGKRSHFCLTRKRDDIESSWASGQLKSCHLSLCSFQSLEETQTQEPGASRMPPLQSLLCCTALTSSFFPCCTIIVCNYSLQWNCKITVRHGWILLSHPGAVKNQILLLFLIHSQAFLHCFGTVWGCQMDTNLPPPLSPPG